jgi:hypothetical protein
MGDQTAATSRTMLEYISLCNKCKCIAARIHPLYQKQYDNVAAIMSIPAGMTIH